MGNGCNCGDGEDSNQITKPTTKRQGTAGSLAPELLDDGEDNEYFEPEIRSDNPKVLKTLKKASKFNWGKGQRIDKTLRRE